MVAVDDVKPKGKTSEPCAIGKDKVSPLVINTSGLNKLKVEIGGAYVAIYIYCVDFNGRLRMRPLAV